MHELSFYMPYIRRNNMSATFQQNYPQVLLQAATTENNNNVSNNDHTKLYVVDNHTI